MHGSSSTVLSDDDEGSHGVGRRQRGGKQRFSKLATMADLGNRVRVRVRVTEELL